MLHRNSDEGHNHKITNFTYVDEAERLAATSYLFSGTAIPFGLADVGKTAKQGNDLDGYTFWVISNVVVDAGVTVTWSALGGGSGSQAKAVLHGFNRSLLYEHANTIIDEMEGDYVINLPAPTFDYAVDFPLGGQVEIYNNPSSNTDITFDVGVTLTKIDAGDLTGTYALTNGEKANLTKLSDDRWLMEASRELPPSILWTISFDTRSERNAATPQAYAANTVCKQQDTGQLFILKKSDLGEGSYIPYWSELGTIPDQNPITSIPEYFTLLGTAITLDAGHEWTYMKPQTFTVETTSAVTITIPMGIQGLIFKFIQENVYPVTLAAASGVTIKGATVTSSQYQRITLERTNTYTDTWYCFIN